MTETKSERIAAELEALRTASGVIDAKAVVDWARENPNSALHSQFEWDDSKAAAEFRLHQARRVIAVHLVAEDGHRTVVSLTIDRPRGGGYRPVDNVLRDDELRKVLLRDALAEFKRTRAKYQHLKELASVYDAIDEADARYGEPRASATQAAA